MPSFTKAKTFAKCSRVYKIFCSCNIFFFFFYQPFLYAFFTYFGMVPWASNSSATTNLSSKTCPAKTETLEAEKKKQIVNKKTWRQVRSVKHL